MVFFLFVWVFWVFLFVFLQNSRSIFLLQRGTLQYCFFFCLFFVFQIGHAKRLNCYICPKFLAFNLLMFWDIHVKTLTQISKCPKNSQKLGESAFLKVKNIKKSILICEAKISQKSKRSTSDLVEQKMF